MIISVVFRSYLTNKCTRSPAMMQTGPNDARHVVWAIGMSFLISVRVFHILMIISVIFRLYLSNKCTRRPAITQTGPNDARRVVWAIGMKAGTPNTTITTTRQQDDHYDR